MPLSTDETVNTTSQGLVSQLQGIFGKHPGFRPAHAHGLLLTGSFTPSPTAASLSKAPHFNNPSTPLTVRFSSSTGIPQIPDTDANSNPRGIAVRFNLPPVDGRRVHTDIIAHSYNGFPTRTGAEFLEFLQAIVASSAPDVEHPSPVEKFFGTHPTALTFATAPKPSPTSFGKSAYFGVNAFKLISAEGKETYIRYKIIPVAGEEHYTDEELKEKSPTYLFDEVPTALEAGPIKFKLSAQVAQEGDTTDDATVSWPDSRDVVELGTIEVEKVVENTEAEQKRLIFDPIPRVEGVDVSADPLLDVRASVYLISGRERRAA